MTIPAQNTSTDPNAAAAVGGDMTATPTVGTPPPSGNVKTFSQEEVNRIAANAREEGRRSAAARSTTPTGNSPEGIPNDDKLSLKGLHQTIAELKDQLAGERERALFDRDALSMNISIDRADDLYDLFRAQKPGDRRAWMLEKSARWGFASAPANAGVTNTASQNAAPAVAATNVPANPATPAPQNALPASNRGAPPPSQVPIEEMDVLRMSVDSPSDFKALIAQKGVKWVNDKLRSQLKGRPVKLRAS